MEQHVNPSAQVSHHVMPANKIFPNNNHLPVLVYKEVFSLPEAEATSYIEELFNKNNWKNSWRDAIFTYDHYHSNSHEVLGVSNGNCMLQLGGDDGSITTLCKGDVIIIPAGVAHKNVGCSEDFECIGAYPQGNDYDIKTGKPEERPEADENIKNVPLPNTDPVFGHHGPLLEHWKKDETKKVIETVPQF